MKKTLAEILIAVLLAVMLPIGMAGVLSRHAEAPPAETETAASTPAPTPEKTVTVQTALGVTEMVLEDYLVGVVMAEMPASFEPEALKAQAVVARTYTLRQQTYGGKHPDAAVCTDAQCCQAYCSREQYRENGGSDENIRRLEEAVAETRAQVLTYEDTLIEATYFSCSGGKTEAAVAVWGSDIPYLQAVESPGEEASDHYVSTHSFSAEEFARLLDIRGDTPPESWVGKVTYTAGGGVETMEIGGSSFTGTELRRLLSLPSTAFALTAVGDRITVTAKGFGHRVGMSQFGANAMAEAGSTYRQILAYYYPGTLLQTQ